MQGYTLGDVDGLPERTANAQPRPLRQLLTFNEPNHVDQVGTVSCVRAEMVDKSATPDAGRSVKKWRLCRGGTQVFC